VSYGFLILFSDILGDNKFLFSDILGDNKFLFSDILGDNKFLFSVISAISWQSVLLVEETGGPRENHRPVVSH
jgi:hypothetical protein